MVLIVAGLLGSSVYKLESTALVSTKNDEDSALLTDDGKYLLQFTGTRSQTGSQQSQRTYADFDVFTDGGSTLIGTVDPHTDIYPVSGAAVRAVILGRPFEDVFVVADEPFDGSSEAIALRVVVFPLIRWVWIGAILLCVGAVVSLWPRMRPQEALADDAAAELAARGRASEASA
jgi:cytochrome c-type biogenesis protein CcmF